MYKNVISMLYKKLLGSRYGLDDLGKFNFVLLCILVVLDLFFDSYIIGILQLLLMVIITYRFMSKNVYTRLRENEKYLDIKYMVCKPFRNIKRNITDKKHIYKKCKCGTIVKVGLPKKIGIKHATCPNCGKRVRILALKRKK